MLEEIKRLRGQLKRAKQCASMPKDCADCTLKVLCPDMTIGFNAACLTAIFDYIDAEPEEAP